MVFASGCKPMPVGCGMRASMADGLPAGSGRRGPVPQCVCRHHRGSASLNAQDANPYKPSLPTCDSLFIKKLCEMLKPHKAAPSSSSLQRMAL